MTKHPAAIAVDKWVEANEASADVATLIPTECKKSVYLLNRLRAAFQAGWAAHEAHAAKEE